MFKKSGIDTQHKIMASIAKILEKEIVEIIELIPRTNVMLKIFDPIIFPNARDVFPLQQ